MTQPMIQLTAQIIEWGGIYLIAVQLVYFIFLFLGMIAIRRDQREAAQWRQSLDLKEMVLPAVTLLIPACNEEDTIVASVQCALALDYPRLQIWVINDGSIDQTFARLNQNFLLQSQSEKIRVRLTPAEAKGIFQSKSDSRLRVLDKSNSGKADSLNCALQYIATEIVILTDADTRLDSDGVRELIRPLESRKVVAVGAPVRILGTGWFVNFQRLEYLRAFFGGRMHWNFFAKPYLISGAVGAYRTETLAAVGGFPVESRTEDLSLTFRLHQHLADRDQNEGMVFIHRSVCETHVPQKIPALFEQRWRWHRGLAETLWKERGLLFSTHNPVFGFLIMPYLVLIELFSSPIEWLVIISAGVMWFNGALGSIQILVWFGISLWLQILFSLVLALSLKKVSEREMVKDFPWLPTCILEMLGYHQMISAFRVLALIPFERNRDESWRNQQAHRRKLSIWILGMGMLSMTSVQAMDIPSYEGRLGYSNSWISGIENANQWNVGIRTLQNEAVESALNLDTIDRFERNEFQMGGALVFRNWNRQALRIESSIAPGAQILPRFTGLIEASSPIEAILPSTTNPVPFEAVFGVRAMKFEAVTVAVLQPGLDAYLGAHWLFSGRFYGSRVKADSLNEAKLIPGFLLRSAYYFDDQNFAAVFWSQNQEAVYVPGSTRYILVPISTYGLSGTHWFSNLWALQGQLDWQIRSVGPFQNWVTATVQFLFRW